MMSQQPSESTHQKGTPTEQFFLNSALGLNQWWRWVLGFISIVLAWIGIGSILLTYAVCGILNATGAFGVTCSDSDIAKIILGGLGFLVGLLGLWMVVKLIHKKELIQVVTGRPSFDFNRYLYGLLAALFVSLVMFLANRLILQLDMTFQKPDWEYLLYFLIVIILVPIQSGFEEVFFRGYILQGTMQLFKNKLVLAILSGIIFALPHLGNPEPLQYGIAPYFTALVSAGIFFAVLALLDGGIELALGYHAMNNIFMGLVANTEVAAIPTPSLFVIHLDGYALFPNVFMEILGFVLAVLILNLKFKWFKLRAS